MTDRSFLNLKGSGNCFAFQEVFLIKILFEKSRELPSEFSAAWKLLPRVQLLPFNLTPYVSLRFASLKKGLAVAYIARFESSHKTVPRIMLNL
jgi:hypothetical protein